MSFRCPQCANKILQKAEDGSARVRLQGPLQFTADGQAFGACHWCKTIVSLPVTLEKSAPPPTRFVIQKKG